MEGCGHDDDLSNVPIAGRDPIGATVRPTDPMDERAGPGRHGPRWRDFPLGGPLSRCDHAVNHTGREVLMTPEPSSSQATRSADRTAWVALLFGIWIVGGLILVIWADTQDLASDLFATPYHIPFYLGLLTLAIYCAAGVVRARRRGLSWRSGLPTGYGGLLLGLLAVAAGFILDLGWRQGVGLEPNVEIGLAPSRIVLVLGLLLIASAPLRAALVLGGDRVPRMAVIVSSALTLT